MSVREAEEELAEAREAVLELMVSVYNGIDVHEDIRKPARIRLSRAQTALSEALSEIDGLTWAARQ